MQFSAVGSNDPANDGNAPPTAVPFHAIEDKTQPASHCPTMPASPTAGAPRSRGMQPINSISESDKTYQGGLRALKGIDLDTSGSKRALARVICGSAMTSAHLQSLQRSPAWQVRRRGRADPAYLTRSISLGRQLLSKKGSSGPYSRRITNQPLPGIVWIQLPRFTPSGCFGAK